MSLVVEHICTSPVKFTQISLHHALNSWYLLGMRIMAIDLFATHKGMLYSTLPKLSLMKNSSLDVYLLIPESKCLLVD